MKQVFIYTIFLAVFTQTVFAVEPITVAISAAKAFYSAYALVGKSDIEMPNVPLPVTNAHMWWNTLDTCADWELQEHIITGHCRIIDDKDYRRAWGGKEPLSKLFKQMKTEYEKEGGVPGGKKMNSLKSDHPLSMPNLKLKVENAHIFWNVLDSYNGWELQQNKTTRHCRIIDNQNYRRAWGGKDGMKTLFEQIKNEGIQIENDYKINK